MEVVYLISRAKKGSGPVNQALNVLTGLNRIKGTHAVLMTMAPEKDGDTWLYRFIDAHIDIIQLNKSSFEFWRCVRMINNYIDENNVDIVHSSGFRADFVNGLLRNVCKVSTQRNQPDQFAERLPIYIKWVVQRMHIKVLSRMNTIVACSKSLQQQYEQACRRQVHVVQNGVDTSRFIPAQNKDRILLRKKLSINENSIVYLVMGWMGPRKNVGMIIESFEKLREKSIKLLIMGDGPLENDLKEQTKEDKRFLFVGKKENPLEYIQASDILISASLSEGLPNTVLEALACGLPCILSDIDPHKELIEGTGAGVLFSRYDENELEAAIKDSTKWNLVEMSMKARETAKKNFNIDTLAGNYMKVYDEVWNYHTL